MNTGENIFQSPNNPHYSGTQELLDTEANLIRYSTSIVDKLYSYLELNKVVKENNGSLLEFGAGIGFLANIFYVRYNIKPTCIEISPDLVRVIRNKNFECYQYLKETTQQYEAIYSSNVLEHIVDDTETLYELNLSLKENGMIGIYVPAHNFLFSSLDKQVGHVRRYSKNELVVKVQNAGFKIIRIQYDDCLGFFASILIKIVGYKNKANLGNSQSLKIYDKYIYPVSRILDNVGASKLLGKNILLIAQKIQNPIVNK